MYGSNKNSFADLMTMAKQNADHAKKKSNLGLYPDKTRKVDPKEQKLKQGVAAFLAKREEEDKRRMLEVKQKRDKLLQLRNQDRKAANRVRKMLSMTKSANKSCVDDAKDCLNESVAAQGEIQPDEDDYGYTSNYADMMHKKMMEKYKSIPIKPAFPEARVPVPKVQSLSKNGTGWRKSHNEYQGDSSPEPEHEPEPVQSSKLKKPTKVPNKPPPVDYQQLLQMAQQKQAQPGSALPQVVEVKKKGEREEFEYGRPMTAKEKAQFLVDKDLKDRVARRLDQNSDKNNNSSMDARAIKPGTSFKIPKANSRPNEEDVVPAKKPRLSEPEPSLMAKDGQKSRPMEHMNGFTNTKAQNVSNGRTNGLKQSAPILSKALDRPQKQGNSPPDQLTKSRDSARPSANVKSEYKSNNSERFDKERSRFPPAAVERDRDQMRKFATTNDNRSKTGRETGQRILGARENSRNGMTSYEKSNSPREMERGHMKMDGSPSQRRDMQSGVKRDNMPSSQKRDLQSAPRRDMLQPQRKDAQMTQKRNLQPTQRNDIPQREMQPPQRREMPPSQRREAPPSQQRRDLPPTQQRRDLPPTQQRRDLPPTQQRKDMPPPQQRRDLPPTQQRRDLPPTQQRRDMPPSQQRRDMPPSQQRRDVQQNQRRDQPPTSRRDMDIRNGGRMRDEPPRMKPKQIKGRAIIDSDEEYDSEMDDFIDDSEVDAGDISAEISRIFNYDRKRYNYDESDDECMESSVAQQMREEQNSLRIGIREDMEDMAREEEEKKRMKMMSKKKGGR